MAINRRVMNKIQEMADGDMVVLGLLRELICYEAEGSGRYTREYEEILKRYAEEEAKK